ncbi:hypothetical protein [Halomonas denitrificans]|nr:hypothetical protein [Halomonas denitrificans]
MVNGGFNRHESARDARAFFYPTERVARYSAIVQDKTGVWRKELVGNHATASWQAANREKFGGFCTSFLYPVLSPPNLELCFQTEFSCRFTLEISEEKRMTLNDLLDQIYRSNQDSAVVERTKVVTGNTDGSGNYPRLTIKLDSNEYTFRKTEDGWVPE